MKAEEDNATLRATLAARDAALQELVAIVDEFDAEFTRIAQLDRPEKEKYKMPMLTAFMFLNKFKEARLRGTLAPQEPPG